MVGEFGGIGAFQPGHEWAEGGCFAYLPNPDAKNESETYIAMTQVLLANKRTVSTCVFTQITDVENEWQVLLLCPTATRRRHSPPTPLGP